MFSTYRSVFLSAALFIAAFLGTYFVPDVAMAQVPNNLSVEASGNASSIVISVSMDIGGELPVEWVGWVLDRRTIGVCDQPVVQIGETRAFPVGAANFVLTDYSAVGGITYFYRVYAVDAAGERHYLPGYSEFPPAYYHFDYASLNNNGVVAEGTLTDLSWTAGIDLCPDGCWQYLSFISEVPPELMDLMGTSTVVRIYGQIDAEFEGSYISQITDWSIIYDCSPVAVEPVNWGGLKALYR